MNRTPDPVFKAATHDLLLEQVRRGHGKAEVLQLQPGERDGRRALRTAVASIAVLGTMAAAWFGVTALLDHRTEPRPAATHAATPSEPMPSRTVDPIIAPLAEVIGSGTFAGRASGNFTITQKDGGPEMRLRNFDSGGVKQMRVLLAVDLDSAACRGNRVGFLAGTVTDAKTQTVVLQDSSPQRFSDLSYIHAVGLWPVDGCSGGEPDVVASVTAAPITWKVPAALRDLASIDRGPGPAARGTTQTRDGRPYRYTVAADDSINAVAARFDLTADELLYLNPLRRRGNDTTLYVDEQLNLDQTNRDWFWV